MCQAVNRAVARTKAMNMTPGDLIDEIQHAYSDPKIKYHGVTRDIWLHYLWQSAIDREIEVPMVTMKHRGQAA